MERNTMMAGSYPEIITSGGNPRVNKEALDNAFVRKYIALFGELLKVKGDLKDIKITYLGGHDKEKSISRSKLYISAFNHCLKALGYDTLTKSNLTVLTPETIEENITNLEQSDLMFLGIGTDQILFKTVEALEKKGIYLNDLITNKNMLVTSICSGSVMSAERIYGGVYDAFYYQKEPFNYPLTVPSLALNPVTMETNFLPGDMSYEKSLTFIEDYLKPDSNKNLIFACRPNSLFLIGQQDITAYGEIYLFADGQKYAVTAEEEMVDVTTLVTLVNRYNALKDRQEVFDETLLGTIKEELASLKKKPFSSEWSKEEANIIAEFKQKEMFKKEADQEINRKWQNNLKARLSYFLSAEAIDEFVNDASVQEKFKSLDPALVSSYNASSLEELYVKMNIVKTVKKSYLSYPGYYSDFRNSFYNLLENTLEDNQLLVYYCIDSCGSLFTNQELKSLLKNITTEGLRKPQVIIDSSKQRQKLFRKERKYEGSKSRSAIA